jgi:DNA polymerase III sliding clamp (beta) subunit (PCNA family)
VTEFAIAPDILQALGASTSAVQLTLTNDGFMSYRKAGISGKVALCDPSSIPMMHKPQSLTLVDFDFSLIKDLLSATAFASADPRLASVGPITHIATGRGMIQVSTYDSMSGIIARKQHEAFKEGFELVIPNRTLMALITNSAKDVVKVGYDENVYYVRSQSTEVVMPKSDYPAIDIASHIKGAIESARSSFVVAGAAFYEAMDRISSMTKVDKDTLSVEVKFNPDSGIQINSTSAKATATANLRVEAKLDDPFSAMFDHQRLTSFTKSVAKADTLDVYFSGQRMIFVTPNVTYAFPGS